MSERIAVITTSYPRAPGDASGHFVASEVRELVRAGHDVQVIAPGFGGFAEPGARVHWLGDRGAFGWPGAVTRLRENPLRAFGVAEFVLRAERALRGERPCTRVHAHFLLPSAWPIATRGVGRDANCELDLIGHGSDVRLFCRLPKQLRKRIARAWLLRRARLRVTSSELQRLLGAANPELLSSIFVKPAALDLQGVPSRARARRELGLIDGAKIALIVARLIPEKRVQVALRALALQHETSAIVVGDGPELDALRREFPRVRFVGRVPRQQALAFIAAADVLVSASAHEGAPSVVREARALGVPVVAVAAGDLRQWAERDAGIWLARG
ncbi:MAG TPA: glycosyltransferase [Polyangiaceae bacterium]|nr:glycosyltransferase [Polyangiaceae bacterium]